ncbi:MAG: hypothetical protein WC861_03520 [Candidatus Micrarchaeia archaeon]|jgi:hypothetical protein
MDIDGAWRSTCKVLLGGEIGKLSDCSGYLSGHGELSEKKTSCLSGSDVYTSMRGACKAARFASCDELLGKDASGAFKLEEKQMRDLDSILEAVSEQACYAGNIVLGNSSACAKCDQCSDVHFVERSHNVSGSKYVAYSFLTRSCDHIFGSGFLGEASHLIKTFYAFRPVRCFECIRTMYSSDCYYCASLEGCTSCMFSFNLKNRNFCIGNCQLSKEKYASLRSSLVAQIRDELSSKKKIPGIIGLFSSLPARQAPPKQAQAKQGNSIFDLAHHPFPRQIEEAFSSTTQLLLGRRLSNLADYESWLARNVRMPSRFASAASGKPLYLVPLFFSPKLSHRSILLEECEEAGKLSLSEEQLEKLCIGNMGKLLEPLAFLTPETKSGDNFNVGESVDYGSTMNCWAGSVYWTSKNCAYDFWIRDGECIFGSDLVFYSKFCLKCYSSNYLARCLEVSASLSCSDCYFCHNCENCHDCLFCFNAKNLKYAVGNRELPKEEYLEVKKALLARISKQLEEKKSLKLSIYSIGCK